MAVRVSVLLPVYNAAPYLPAALASLEPDLTDDVEVIAVDDGSTDGSGEILDRWRHPRVQVVHQENVRLVGALTTAAGYASAPLLARMDGDDVNRPGRIAACRQLLDSRPEVGLVSPWAQQIDGAGHPTVLYQPPWRPADVARTLYVSNPIVHGATMFRREVYDAAGGYQPSACEDLHLWDRMSTFAAVALVPAVLYDYRHHAHSYTGRNAEAQLREKERICAARWDRQPPVPAAPWAARRYRNTPSWAVVKGDMRALAGTAKARRDLPRLAAFAAAFYAA